MVSVTSEFYTKIIMLGTGNEVAKINQLVIITNLINFNSVLHKYQYHI